MDADVTARKQVGDVSSAERAFATDAAARFQFGHPAAGEEDL